jgi:predicted amidohydrolase
VKRLTWLAFRPAQLLELSDYGIGQLSVGSPADFILFTFKDGEIKLIETVSNGSTVFRTPN